MATAPAFKVGDTVKLKAGGPVMTVHMVPSTSSNYTCQWFAGKKLDRGNFKVEELVAASPEAPLAPATDEKR